MASPAGCKQCCAEHANIQKELQEQDEFIFELQQNEEALEKEVRDANKALVKWQVQAEDMAGALADIEQDRDARAEEDAELRSAMTALVSAVENYKDEIVEKDREIEVTRSTYLDLTQSYEELDAKFKKLSGSFAIVQDEHEKEKKISRKLRTALDSSEHEITNFEVALAAMRRECGEACARADQVEGEMVVCLKEMAKVEKEKRWVQDAVGVQARKHKIEKDGLEKEKVSAVSELEGFVAELEMELQKGDDDSGIIDVKEQLRQLQLDIDAERAAHLSDRTLIDEHTHKITQMVQENNGLRAKVESLLTALELEREKNKQRQELGREHMLARGSCNTRLSEKTSERKSSQKRINLATQSRKVGLKKNDGPEVDIVDCNLPGNLPDPLDSSTDLESSYECRSPTESAFHASPFFCDDEKAVADMLSKSNEGSRKHRRRIRSHSHSPPHSPSASAKKTSTTKSPTTERRKHKNKVERGIFDIAARDGRCEDDTPSCHIALSQSASFPLSRSSWKSSLAKKKRVLVLPESGNLRSRTPEHESVSV